MDTNPQHTESEIQLNHALAESESLKAQLEEYLYIISMRDKEIETLRSKLTEKTEYKSNSDNREMELQLMQDNIQLLHLRTKGSTEREMELEQQVGYAISNEHQLEDTKQKITYLQTQLYDLEEQVKDLTDRNLLLQQEASRTAELESLLEDAERERDEIKQQLSSEE